MAATHHQPGSSFQVYSTCREQNLDPHPKCEGTPAKVINIPDQRQGADVVEEPPSKVSSAKLRRTGSRKQGFIEVMAGTAQMTETASALGYFRLYSPVELYEDPIKQTGRRDDHDVTLQAVQERLMAMAYDKAGPTVWMMAPLCQSFSNWMKLNRGTRTVERPEGDPETMLAQEKIGNQVAKFIAQLFMALLTVGKMPIVENSGKSSHKGFDYVKIWDTKWWKSILLRDDVMIVDVKMCGYSKRPAAAAEIDFCVKQTWWVTHNGRAR